VVNGSLRDRAASRIALPPTMPSGSGCVLVVDDDPIVRAGWSAVLGRQSWVEQCLSVAGLHQAVDQVLLHRPEVALIGLFLDDGHGVEVCRRLRELDPELRVLLVTEEHGLPLRAARAAGAAGLMQRGAGVEALVDAVWRVSIGQQAYAEVPARTTASSRLSRRERTVLCMLAGGASNVEIASALNLSPHTIKEYTQTVFRKLGVRNRVEAATTATRLGYSD